jgi:hypothetical protein
MGTYKGLSGTHYRTTLFGERNDDHMRTARDELGKHV